MYLFNLCEKSQDCIDMARQLCLYLCLDQPNNQWSYSYMILEKRKSNL